MKESNELPKRLRKPKLGYNAALRPGAGPHKPRRRQQNELLKLIEEELILMDELKEV